MRKFTADKSAEGLRTDVFLTRKFPKFTRSSLKQLFKRGLVKVNNIAVKSSRKVHFSDKVSVDDRLLISNPAPLKLPLIYEDKDVIIVNKPTGVLTHSKGALNSEATVASTMRPKIDPSLSGNRAGIVHRLDRGTSGVIILAKNQQSISYLQKQFSKRQVKKTYRAVVEGAPKPGHALIDAPIARNPKRPQTFTVKSGGKPAQTEYQVDRLLRKGNKKYSLLDIRPITGRTHQIRVHLKYIGHPIVGDSIYGQPGEALLHATSLELTLPSGQRKVFRAPAPPKFKKFIDDGEK